MSIYLQIFVSQKGRRKEEGRRRIVKLRVKLRIVKLRLHEGRKINSFLLVDSEPTDVNAKQPRDKCDQLAVKGF